MKLLLENWRQYINEAAGLDAAWGNVHIDDVFKLIGKSCDEGRKCKSMSASKLEDMIKDKEILHRVRKHLDPKRIETADYKFPLIVVVDNGEYQYILDGNHRLAAALAAEEEGKNVIVKVKELYNDEYNELFRGQK
jgi:hypothetical protein